MKKLRQSFVLTLIILLSLSSFNFNVYAQGSDPNLAELHAEIDASSDEDISVIVELDEDSIAEAKHKGKYQTKKKLKDAREDVIKKLKKGKVNREYDYVFSGFSAEIPMNEIPELLAVPGVKAVYPNITYHVLGDQNGDLLTEEAYSPEMLQSAPYIGANQAWDTGYTGEGITVAVIDTGADYTHPDLQHAFGDYKGWDLVDNDADPQETQANDPRGAATSHGTHVSGTVAANGLIKGVAPDATLLAYRVLGPGGSGTTENVIAGIEMAVQDGADIMNLSLGNSLNNPDYATSIALDWAMAEGVVAVTSNGNSGPENWTVGSPGTSRDAISVGATRLPYFTYASTVNTKDISVPSAKVMGQPSDQELLDLNGNHEFVYAGLGSPDEFAQIDVTGKIALISRGAYAFVDKAANAKSAGAIGAIIFNHTAGEEIPYEIPGMAVPTIKTTLEDGQNLLAELDKGTNTISINITQTGSVGETIADFSSRGPVVNTWMIKPDVSAPGVNITSTVPTHNPSNPHGYAAYQGTSMAAPHVAGAAALLLQAHPDWSVDYVKAALMNTADSLVDAAGKEYDHNTQGAGGIRVVEALNATTLVTPGSHSFGVFATEEEEREHKITIHNLTNSKKNYSLKVKFEGKPEAIEVDTIEDRVSIKGHKSKDISVEIEVENEENELQPGYYEGTIEVSDGTNTTIVPIILFVDEPDYPRITHFGFTGNDMYMYTPTGAEVAGLWFYNVNGFTFAGDDVVGTNIAKDFYEFTWDGDVAGQSLAPGTYYVFGYADQKGQLDYVYGGTITIE